MIVTLSQISSTSTMSWLLSRTVRPLPARRLTRARMSRMPAGGRPLAGARRGSRGGGRGGGGGGRAAQGRGGAAGPLPHPEGVAADLVPVPADEVDRLEDVV